MLVLFETPAGYALFKVLDEGKLKNVDNIYKYFETADAAQGLYVALHCLPERSFAHRYLNVLNSIPRNPRD